MSFLTPTWTAAINGFSMLVSMNAVVGKAQLLKMGKLQKSQVGSGGKWKVRLVVTLFVSPFSIMHCIFFP